LPEPLTTEPALDCIQGRLRGEGMLAERDHYAVIPGLPVRAEPGIQKVFGNRFGSLDSGFRYAAPE
jgi:hypothetical protein